MVPFLVAYLLLDQISPFIYENTTTVAYIKQSVITSPLFIGDCDNSPSCYKFVDYLHFTINNCTNMYTNHCNININCYYNQSLNWNKHEWLCHGDIMKTHTLMDDGYELIYDIICKNECKLEILHIQ